MEIEILNQNGSGDSKVSLADGIFNQEFNQDLVHQLVNTYIHNSHQRTKGQKNRSAVRGGGKNLGNKKEQVEQELERSDLQYGEAAV